MSEPPRPRRKQLRLKGWDYSRGGIYFLTLCVHGRRNLFGHIAGGKVDLSPAGRMIEEVWAGMPDHNPGLVLDALVVMPDHFHAIIGLIDPWPGRGQCLAATPDRDAHPATAADVGDAPARPSVPGVVRKFKTYTMRHYRDGVEGRGWPAYDRHLWQRGYTDHIIVADADLEHHRDYIWNNPLNWELQRRQ